MIIKMRLRLVTVALIASCSLHPDVASAAASRDLWGKSIVMNWTEVSQVHRERNPRKGGNDFEVSRTGEAKVYISDKGRLFSKANLQGANGRGRHRTQGAMEQSPDTEDEEGVDKASPWHWQISGYQLIATRVFTQGAARLNATIQPDGSCQIQVVLGKENGTIVRTGGRRNRPEEVLSNETRDGICQVVQGNVLAQ